MSDPTKSYEALLDALRDIALLGSVASLLGWDERTYMPPGGAEFRARQSSMLARMLHEQFTSPRIGELLAGVEGTPLHSDPIGDAAVNVREVRRSYDRQRKLPTSLVAEMARVSVLAERAWVEARKKSCYADFRPWLGQVVSLKRQEADCVGFKDHPYDALLDDYEPGETTANVRKVFESLRDPLVELVAKVAASGRKAPIEVVRRRFAIADQEKFSREAAARIGFDFTKGRLDVTAHPFCSGIGPGDTRLTTRYDENCFSDAFFSVLHEAGHGLYDQGLPHEHFGTPRGDSVSLGIHESQSRLWENFVGRGRPFWRYFFPRAKSVFGAALADVREEQWVFAINNIEPSLIRVEADETTYNLHVLLRFELEQAMISGDLAVADIPGAWNEKMKKYLGIVPPDDAHGCLQDVHWSGMGIGYFPTYTLGNLCAAQFFQQAQRDLGDLSAQFARGEFAALLDWLHRNIHSQGKRYRARDLVMKVTGRQLSAQPLLEHLRKKMMEWYA